MGGDNGFIRDMEIQGFKIYSIEELEKKRKTYTYLNMSEIGMKISPGKYYIFLTPLKTTMITFVMRLSTKRATREGRKVFHTVCAAAEATTFSECQI